MGERGSYAQKQTSIISIQTIILEISFYIRELAKICNFAVNIALNKFQKNTNCLKWVIHESRKYGKYELEKLQICTG